MHKNAFQKRLTAVLLVIVLVLSCTACQSKDDEIYDALTSAKSAESEPASQASQPEESTLSDSGELSGELTITVCIKDTTLEDWADRFMKKHPGVTVKQDYFITGDETSEPGWSERFASSIVPRLMSGEAGDIVDTLTLDFDRYADSGLLTDFHTLMENDPDFHTEDYYTNIFEAMERTDGGLYTFPLCFSYPFFVLNNSVVSGLGPEVMASYADGADYKEIIDLYEQAREAGVLEEDCWFAWGQNKNFFEGVAFPGFFDRKNREAHFDSPEFVEYLKKTDTLYVENTVQQGFIGMVMWPDFSVYPGFCQNTSFSYITLSDMLNAEPGQVLHYRNEQGGAFFTPNKLLAIPKGANTELAWEFIKFMTEEKNFSEDEDFNSLLEVDRFQAYTFYAPINRNNFLYLYGNTFGEQEAAELDEYNRTLNLLLGTSSELADNLLEIEEKFYDNHLISAEECAKQMQERAWIYLNE